MATQKFIFMVVQWNRSLCPYPVQYSDAHNLKACAAKKGCTGAADCTLSLVIHHQLIITSHPNHLSLVTTCDVPRECLRDVVLLK